MFKSGHWKTNEKGKSEKKQITNIKNLYSVKLDVTMRNKQYAN